MESNYFYFSSILLDSALQEYQTNHARQREEAKVGEDKASKLARWAFVNYWFGEFSFQVPYGYVESCITAAFVLHETFEASVSINVFTVVA